MKLRQKLVVALAAAMVVTSVPVVTVAASTNTITRPSTVVKDGWEFSLADAPATHIKFDKFSDTEEFYLTLENAKWNSDVEAVLNVNPDEVAVKVIDKKVLKVQVKSIPTTGPCASDTDSIKIPMLVTLEGGEATVEISAEGGFSSVTEGKLVFAKTTKDVATAAVSSVETINGDGKIGTIVIAETYTGAMGGKFALIELNNSDYQFDMDTTKSGVLSKDSNEYVIEEVNGEIKATASTSSSKDKYAKYTVAAKFTYGYADEATQTVDVFVSEDADHVYVQLPVVADAKSRGRVEINNLYIESTVKNPAEGEITVDVSGDVAEAKNLVVAVSGKYNATISTEEVVKVLAGEKETVKFKIKENVEGTFTNGRAMKVSVDNGYFIEAELTTNDKVDTAETLKALQAAIKSLKLNNTAENAEDMITDVEVKDEKVVGFTIKSNKIQTPDKIDELEIELDLAASIKAKGDVTLKVESRDFQEDITSVIAEIRSAVEVTTEDVVLKTGLLNQVGGKVTVAESEAGVLNRGEYLYVYLPSVKGITFQTAASKLPEIKVTSGDIQVGDAKIVNTTNLDGKEVQALRLTVKRGSKAASTIEISNFHIDTDRTVAEGSYDIEIGGKAVTSHDETIEVADFIKIGTANTEDLVGANGLAKGTSVFVIGESKYTLNGEEKLMDAQSYIQNPGYTMIPVRYVAEAFGVAGNNVLFSNGVVTLFAGNRTIQLTVGSDIAVVNGAQIKMSTKVAAQNGRTYAPVGEIARILGVSCDWDNTTKTATFTNK